jgi:hypothetical protein
MVPYTSSQASHKHSRLDYQPAYLSGYATPSVLETPTSQDPQNEVWYLTQVLKPHNYKHSRLDYQQAYLSGYATPSVLETLTS